MKAAVISDIHENYHNLTLFLLQLRKYKIDKIFFLGDFVNAGLALTLAEYEIPTYAVWGNNDGDRPAIVRVSCREQSNLTIGFDTYDMVDFDNRKIFLTHFPIPAEHMAKSGDFDAVFYGHDHKKKMHQINNCLVLNPGEISAHKTGLATFAIYDSVTNKAEILPVEGNQITVLTDTVREFRKTIKFDAG